jgi:2-keto-3-deoxy-L-rhamnonate aldolase RhmA
MNTTNTQMVDYWYHPPVHITIRAKGKAHQKRRDYELQLRAVASTTQAPVMKKVATYDTAMNNTFDVGYQALIHWYNQHSM